MANENGQNVVTLSSLPDELDETLKAKQAYEAQELSLLKQFQSLSAEHQSVKLSLEAETAKKEHDPQNASIRLITDLTQHEAELAIKRHEIHSKLMETRTAFDGETAKFDKLYKPLSRIAYTNNQRAVASDISPERQRILDRLPKPPRVEPPKITPKTKDVMLALLEWYGRPLASTQLYEALLDQGLKVTLANVKSTISQSDEFVRVGKTSTYFIRDVKL